ncbi:hypothetical protein PGT21_033554 [Puccinia graminis f. sp. tritici]|uniref:Uncharacterized protein n=1 Tax=Puccinia graminis f. sp. tritici TaxID=56615 RepID=A0A5B0QZJ9_PUCGR|nr:hypothetical protein PGT21_033554 [Puccinia graminis f. sp. tritici]
MFKDKMLRRCMNQEQGWQMGLSTCKHHINKTRLCLEICVESNSQGNLPIVQHPSPPP